MCSCIFFFKQKTAYEMRISDWSSDVCSSDLKRQHKQRLDQIGRHIEKLDSELADTVTAEPALARRHEIISSIVGIGFRTANQLDATMPELGTLDSKQVASLAGLDPVDRQSGQWKGRRFIQGGRDRTSTRMNSSHK